MSWLRAPTCIEVLSLMVFWGQIQNYMMRANLSILIVEMVEVKPSNGTGGVTANESCIIEEDDFSPINSSKKLLTDTDTVEESAKLDWDAFKRGLIFSSFSYGYLTTQIIGGRLAELYGAKLVFGLGLLLTSAGTLLSPVVAQVHYGAFMALRISQGIFEGVTFPSLHAMAARWVPIEERNGFVARSFFGTMIGKLITLPLCAFLADAYGWESGFYVTGACTLVWFVFWCFLVFDTPDSHPRISVEERERIRTSLEKTNSDERLPVPWKSILTSPPFLALMTSDACNTFAAVVFFTNWSTYLKYMLGTDIKTNGILSALPFACRYVGGLLHGKIADTLYSRGVLRLVTIRRIFNSICMLAPAFTSVLVAWSGCSVAYTVSLVCVGFFFNGALSSGHFSSPMDLAPNFAGTVFGITNSVAGGSMGTIAPIVVGAITKDNMTFSAWRTIFLMGGAIYAFGALVYAILIKAEPQPWNFPQRTSSSGEKAEVEEKESCIQKAD